MGDYNTHYNSIFSSRVPPPRIRLIHRTLAVRRKAIDSHAEAIVAALDALESTGEELRDRGQGLATLLATFEQLKHERRAFMADVRAYNQEIAEYAFAVAPPQATGETLVSMLIKTSRAPSKALATDRAVACRAGRIEPRSRPIPPRPKTQHWPRHTRQTIAEKPAMTWAFTKVYWKSTRPSACRSWRACCIGTATFRPTAAKRRRSSNVCVAWRRRNGWP